MNAVDPPASDRGPETAPLGDKLAGLRRRLVRLEVTRRLAIAGAVVIAGIGVAAALDWRFEFPMAVRRGWLVVAAVGAAALLGWALAAVVTARRDDESLALLVERRIPALRGRLIACVQLAMGKGSIPAGAAAAGMIERLRGETESRVASLAFESAADAGRCRRALMTLLVVIVAAGAAVLAWGGVAGDLVRRALLADIPVPRATRVVWTTGDVTVGLGEPLALRARARGFLPDSGTLRIRTSSGSRERFPMVAVPDSAAVQTPPGERLYEAIVEDVRESFTWVAAIHDGHGPEQRVRALPRPVVEDLVGVQTYPAFTGLSPSEHRSGEFLLVPGGELALMIRSSHPLREGVVRLIGDDGRGGDAIPGVVDPREPRLLTASLTTPDDGWEGFTVELVDREGMASRDPTIHRVEILGDEPPIVRLVVPAGELERVTDDARVLLAYEAEDRYGIDHLTLRFVVGGEAPAPGSEARSLPLPVPESERGGRRVEGRFEWALGDLEPRLSAGDEVRYWVEAHDANPRTGPGVSKPGVLEVVTRREKRDELLRRAGDLLGRLGGGADSQERLNAALGEWIRAADPAPPGITGSDQPSDEGGSGPPDDAGNE